MISNHRMIANHRSTDFARRLPREDLPDEGLRRALPAAPQFHRTRPAGLPAPCKPRPESGRLFLIPGAIREGEALHEPHT